MDLVKNLLATLRMIDGLVKKSFAMATLDYVASRRTNIAMGVAFPINSL